MANAPLFERAAALRPSAVSAGLRFLAPFAIGLVIALVAHYLIGPNVTKYRQKILLDMGINIILAVSLNLVNGFTGQFSIGHAGFMGVGGYAAGAIVYYGSFLIWGDAELHGAQGQLLFIAAVLVAGVVAAAAGWVVGLPSLRLRGDYLAIVTLGFGEILRVLIQLSKPLLDDADEIKTTAIPKLATHLGGALGFTGLPYYTSLFSVYCFVAITLITSYRLKVSSWGRAFLAVRENEIAAEAMGIHTTKVKVRAFVLAAFFAGIAGGLFAHESGTSLNPSELGFMRSFDVVIMVVLGGMGSISGAVLAAIVLTILPEALRGVAEYRMIVYALSLVVMMIVRPQGLFGVRELWDMGPLARFFGHGPAEASTKTGPGGAT